MARVAAPSWAARVQAVLARQRDRWILWLPVGVVFGAAALVAAPRDPPLWWSVAALVAGAVLAQLLAALPSLRPRGLRCW